MKEKKADFTFVVEQRDEKKRLDLFLKMKLKEFTRNRIQRWIKSGRILCNGAASQPSRKLAPGDQVLVFVPQEEISAVGENIPLKILFEDKDLLAVNKPAGMVTHPAKGHFRGTLTNAVVYHFQKSHPASIKNFGQKNLRPGIVHRLDKDTSGVMLIAKNSFVLKNLAEQFGSRQVKKVYLALVEGKIYCNQGEIEGAIGLDATGKKMAVSPAGRSARSTFKVLKRFASNTYLEVYPITGRTHQIRVHLSKIGHPVLGDRVYGKKREEIPRLMLHASEISIFHPKTKKRMTFSAPLPDDFLNVLKKLKQGKNG